MRGRSLRFKINVAILLVFVAIALGCGIGLRLHMTGRLSLARKRTQALLAAVATQRLKALAPLLAKSDDPERLRENLLPPLRIDGIDDDALFDAHGTLLAHVGRTTTGPLVAGELKTLPIGRVFLVSPTQISLIAPVSGPDGVLGFLRLRASLSRVRSADQQLWWMFALSLLAGFLLLAGLLNRLLDRQVLRPADRLRRALDAVTPDHPTLDLPTRDDAIGRVATACAAMAARLTEDAATAKRSFLALMGHEIRTPLNVILGLSELLLDQTATAEQRSYLGTINDEAAHLIGVINDILDFSKIEAGKLEFERVPFRLSEVLDAVARTATAQARQKGLDFALTVADDTPPTWRGDPGRLRQVLRSLLGHTIKDTERGGVALAVALADPPDSPADRAGLCFRIEDTSSGLNSERLPGLFSPRPQASDALRGHPGSGDTGLGLAVAKEIVERLGGHLDVRSKPNEGRTLAFTVFLATADPASVPDSASPPVPAASSPRTPRRILLVEDNALNATIIRLHIERMGHALTVVSSAREALKALSRERFDVVLMDLEMPDIDGISATRTIRAGGTPEAGVLNPAVPIVAVTAHAVEHIRQQCLEAGMNDFMTKPINYGALKTLLDGPDGKTPAVAESPATPPAASPAPAGLFDPAAARESMGITWKQYDELRHVSFREACGRLREIEKALDADNTGLAAIAVHTFKGTAATLGAYSSRDLAITLEKAIRADDLETARTLLTELTTLWTAVNQAQAEWHLPEAS